MHAEGEIPGALGKQIKHLEEEAPVPQTMHLIVV